jgi:hypothetical protein
VTTGKTCGWVDSKDYRPTNYIPNANSFIKVRSMCTKDGDSGGPVYDGGKAIGIVSGSDDDGVCNNGNDFTIVGHIEFAQSALNATVITSEPSPSFISLSDARNGSTTVKVNFDQPVKCDTVAPSDFRARVNNVDVAVVDEACDPEDSDPGFTITLQTPLVTGSTVEVTTVGTITDPAGATTGTSTKTTTVQ